MENIANNILVHGYGSKIELLNQVSESLKQYPTLTIHGFVNSLTIKQLLNQICLLISKSSKIGKIDETDEEDEKESKTPKYKKIGSQLQYIARFLDDEDASQKLTFDRLILIIHNIDGKTLRDLENQKILSKLASFKKVIYN